MKHIYNSPEIELMSVARDIITSSADDPWVTAAKWDFSKYSDPADYIDGVNG